MDYTDFTVRVPNGETWHCRFHTRSVGIATRSSDSVDVRFLVNGKPVAIALPNSAFAIFRHRSGLVLTDADSIQMAGLFLKTLVERGERIEESVVSVTVDQTLALAQQIRGVAFA